MSDALAPYRSPEARDEALGSLAARAGAELCEYGRSVEGRPLVAARVPGGAARVLVSANIHGVEYVGAHVALALLEAAAAPAGELARLLGRAELWVIPCINPDAYARVWARGGAGRLVELRTNARGVDLNRNYPMPGGKRPSWLPGAGSPRPGHATYRGEAPLSEPETAALDGLFARQGFAASANLHATMGTLIPARVTARPAYRGYKRLCRAFAAAQPRWRYLRLASRLFDVFTGEQEDHQHHAHRTWAVCVEVFPILASLRQHLRAPSLFWRFNPRDPRPWVDNDLPGLVAYLHAALDLGPPP